MRYVIYGAGAVGSAIGGRLHQAGAEVTLVARGQHFEALKQNGLNLADPDSDAWITVPAVNSIADAAADDQTAVILAMKSQDAEAALRELASTAPGIACVVCAQNGVESERLALRLFPDVFGMMTALPAYLRSPGRVEMAFAPIGGILDFGRYGISAHDSAIPEALAADLTAAGFSSRAVSDIMRWKYAKLLVNLGNVTSLIAGPAKVSPYHALALAEAKACFAAAGIDCADDEEWTQRRAVLPKRRPVAGTTARNSTWQSVARGASSIESDFLNGEVVLLGRLHGVPTPVNQALQIIGQQLIRRQHSFGDPSLVTALDKLIEQCRVI